MTDTYADSSPQSLADYLAPSVESSPDVAVEAELLPESTELQGEQSSPDTEQVAPDGDTEQPNETGETETPGETVSTASTESDVVTPNWDSDENPYLKDARILQEVRQLAEQQQAERAAAAQKEQWNGVIERLAKGELDDEDIPIVRDQLISEISQQAIQPVLGEMEMHKHGFTATVAALRTVLPPEMYEAVKAETQRNLQLGSTAEAVEQAFKTRQAVKSEWDAKESDYQTKIKNLTAQLAAAAIQNSGESRTETVAVGAPMDEPVSVRDYLRQGPI